MLARIGEHRPLRRIRPPGRAGRSGARRPHLWYAGRMPFFALLYDYVPDYLARRGPLRKAHFDHASASMARGEFQMGGAFSDPVDGALLTFKADDRQVIEEFVRNDPYVTGGLVTGWKIREWTVVMGGGVVPPDLSGGR